MGGPARVRTPAKATSADAREPVFAALRDILARHAANLCVAEDGPKGYTLETHVIADYNEKPWFFAGTNPRKRHVSYYLFPVYTDPSLLDGISPALKQRMQGKSCFNFKTVDDALFGELAELTQACYDAWEAQGKIR
jgi:hypothetical protein